MNGPRLAPLVFLLALAACAPEGSGGTASSVPADRAQDLAAIQALHEADVAAVMAGDADALLALWSPEPMALPPEGDILRGREAIATMLEPLRTRDERPWRTVEYVQDFVEVEILGDHAWDLGTVRTRMVHEDGRELVLEGTLLRILRRSADGAWTVHRSAWSNGEPVVTDPRG